jgi:hypothetical protein
MHRLALPLALLLGSGCASTSADLRGCPDLPPALAGGTADSPAGIEPGDLAPALLDILRRYERPAGLPDHDRHQVVFAFVVDENGCARQIRAVEATHEGLIPEFTRLLRTTRFEPARRADGTPVALRVRMPLREPSVGVR